MSEENSHGFEDVKLEDLKHCCGPEAVEMAGFMRGCPCASLMKGSRKAFFGMLLGAGLLFSIVAGGWVLGIVAFFRTL